MRKNTDARGDKTKLQATLCMKAVNKEVTTGNKKSLNGNFGGSYQNYGVTAPKVFLQYILTIIKLKKILDMDIIIISPKLRQL